MAKVGTAAQVTQPAWATSAAFLGCRQVRLCCSVSFFAIDLEREAAGLRPRVSGVAGCRTANSRPRGPCGCREGLALRVRAAGPQSCQLGPMDRRVRR